MPSVVARYMEIVLEDILKEHNWTMHNYDDIMEKVKRNIFHSPPRPSFFKNIICVRSAASQTAQGRDSNSGWTVLRQGH